MTRYKSTASAVALIGAATAMFANRPGPGGMMLRGAAVTFEAPNDHGTKTAAELATEIKAAHEKAFDTVKEIAEKAIAEATKSGKLAETTKEAADEALLKMNGLGEQIAEIEQKLARAPNGQPEQVKSLGEQFVADDKVKSFLGQARPRGSVDLTVKTTLTSLTTNAGGSVGAGVIPTYLSGILPLGQRKMTVRELFSQGQMDGNMLEYVKETGFSNNAAPVAEGAAKPSSDIKFALVSTTAKVIAHYMKASRQVLDDVAQLQSIIDQRLLYGLAYVEEQQLLLGDGTGQNLLGVVPQATAYSAPIALTDATRIDQIRLAMLQAAIALFPATGTVMHNADWASIETLKDGVGRYIIGDPKGSVQPTLWNLPVVESLAMTQGNFLTGAFKLGAQIFDRWQARVEIATENEDDFIKNLVTALAEERLALAVYRPEAFIYGALI